ncbi:MAG: lysophospholipid acyltransferase family protein [bacterium]
MPPTTPQSSQVVPAELKPWMLKFFNARILGPMVRRAWHAVRLAADTGDQPLDDLAAHRGPAIVAMNHHSWWDPMLGLWLSDKYLPGRPCYAPMERAQLAKFVILKKLGIFGVDPDDPATLPLMSAYLGQLWARDRRAVLWITPQGQFADPRVPIHLRPGAAAVAASLPTPPLVVSLTTEMVFWTDKKPELLIRAAAVAAPLSPSTPSWHRALTRAMQANADALRDLAITRDPGRFIVIGGGGAARTNIFYDAWLTLRGRGNRITPTPR